MAKARLRFPPSPTGYLHIGSLRTVLFNYFAAKKMGGELILRIEDTDAKREVQGAVENLIAILDWIGIKFDEGPLIGGKFGPYIQTQRLDIYKKHVDRLLDEGKVYRCFCTPERLEKMRADQQAKKLPPRYDRACRNLSEEDIKKKLAAGEKYVIRQKMPLTGEITVNDGLRGDIKFKAEDLEDHILVKSNGVPTYQLANIVDDHEMEISHVLRGEEWISSFPKNILLYDAFGWQPPEFFHLPLVLDERGGKLSKRTGDVAVEEYKEKGYLPAALINFCVLLGWHPKDDNEILPVNDLIEKFDLKDIGTSPAVFNIEKLDYFNGYYIRHTRLEELVKLARPYLEDNLAKTKIESKKSDDFIKGVLRAEQERLKKLSEIGEATEFFFVDKLDYDIELLAWKKISIEQAQENLKIIHELLEKIPQGSWTNDSIEEGVMSYLKAKNLKVGEFLWPMRVALTGRKASPGPFEVAEVLGKPASLERIKEAIDK